MAISDVYTATAAPSVSSAATATAVASLFGTATKRLWIVGCRVEIESTGAAAGNQVLFQLVRSTSTNITASAAANTAGNAHDNSAPASIGSFATNWSTTPAGTLTVLADWTLPQTPGSAWEEFPPLGYEWGVPAIASGSTSAGVHLFITQNASNATTYAVQLIWSE